jgi:glycolate oxidase
MLGKKIARELQQIVGGDRYLITPEDLLNYSYDAFFPETTPEAVLLPTTTEQVSAIMKVAHREGIPLTPRGAGTNISGGSVPARGGIVLSFTLMNKILEINEEDRYAVVQPGVVNADLQSEVTKLGLFYPPDPASLSVCTIGGNVAENAGGPRGVKYGVTRDYLLGLTLVLADGRIIKTGGCRSRKTTCYDLNALFCGSEGTLGAITEVVVKLLPLPDAQLSIQAMFPNLEGAGQAVAKLLGAGIVPVAIELMDSVVINLIEDAANIGLPRDAEGLLLIMVDGPEGTLKGQVDRIAQFCRDQGASDVRVARDKEENDALWVARRSAFAVMARTRPNCIVEDVTVPVSQLPTMVREIVAAAKKHNIVIGVLAHAGDGNMHPLIITDRRDQEEWQRVEEATKEIFLKAVELGGTLSGEHGIGYAKEPYLNLIMNEDTRQLMKEIKLTLDPRGIMNPGKFV